MNSYDPYQFKIGSLLFSQKKSDTKEPTQLKQIDLNEITKPLQIKLSRGCFISLIKDVVNNLDNKNYQTVINNNKYNLKNAKQFLLDIVVKKIVKMKHANYTKT